MLSLSKHEGLDEEDVGRFCRPVERNLYSVQPE